MTRTLAPADSPSMRDMVRIALTGAGCELTQAADGREALELALESGFDLVLADVNMPVIDGVELIRARRAGRAIPQLIATMHRVLR